MRDEQTVRDEIEKIEKQLKKINANEKKKGNKEVVKRNKRLRDLNKELKEIREITKAKEALSNDKKTEVEEENKKEETVVPEENKTEEVKQPENQENSNENLDYINTIIKSIDDKILDANKEYSEIINYAEKINKTYTSGPVVDNKLQENNVKSFLEENLTYFTGIENIHVYTTDDSAMEFLNKAYSDKKSKIMLEGGSPEIKALNKAMVDLQEEKQKVLKSLKENGSKEDIEKKYELKKQIEDEIKKYEEMHRDQILIEKEFLEREVKFRNELDKIKQERKAKLEYIKEKMYNMYEELQGEYKKLVKLIDSLEEALKKEKLEKENLEKELGKVEEEIGKTKEELKSNQDKIDELNSKLSDPDIKDEEKESINKELEDLTRERFVLETRLLELSDKQSSIKTNIENLKIEEKEKGLDKLKEKEKEMATKLEDYKKVFEKYGFKHQEQKNEYDSQAEKTDEEAEQDLSNEFEDKKDSEDKKDKKDKETSKDKTDDKKKPEQNTKQQGSNNSNQVGGDGGSVEQEKKEEKSLTLWDKDASSKAILQKYIAIRNSNDRKEILELHYEDFVSALNDPKVRLNGTEKSLLKDKISEDQESLISNIDFSDENIQNDIQDLFIKYGNKKISYKIFDELYSSNAKDSNIVNNLGKLSPDNIKLLQNTIAEFYDKVSNGDISDEVEINKFEKYVSNLAKFGVISTSAKILAPGPIEKITNLINNNKQKVNDFHKSINASMSKTKKSNMKDVLSGMNEPNPKPINEEPNVKKEREEVHR